MICFQRKEISMIRDDAKIIVTTTGVSFKKASIEEVVNALNEEASLYKSNDHVPYSLYYPSGKEIRRNRRMLELRKRKGRL